MTAKLNLHKLIAHGSGFLHRLRVTDKVRRTLSEFRETIRATRGGAFANWTSHVIEAELRDALVPAPSGRIKLTDGGGGIPGLYLAAERQALTAVPLAACEDGAYHLAFASSGPIGVAISR